MSLTLTLLWLVAGLFVVTALVPPRRWYRRVTAEVRPGRQEPTAEGYALLAIRNVLVALVVLAVVVPYSLDRLRVSDDELLDSTRLAIDLIDDGRSSSLRLQAELTVLLDREVRVDDVSPEDRTSGSDVRLEVRVADDTTPIEELSDDQVVCVGATSVSDGLGESHLSGMTANEGGCDA